MVWKNNSQESSAGESEILTHASIQIVTNHLTFYGPIVLLVIGTMSCLGNLLTFTDRRLRNNACAFYFLCATFFEFFSISFGLLSRLATDHRRSHLQHTSAIYCKLRAYLISAMPLIATYCILLSAVDRFMSSSPHAHLRSFSRMPVAFRSMLAVIVLGLVSCCHILISYDLRPKCGTLPGLYAVFDGMFVVIWLGVLPHVAMLLFGFGTLRNIRRVRQRSMKFDMRYRRTRLDRKTDGHLILVMFSQTILPTRQAALVLDDAGASRSQFVFDSHANDLLRLLSSRSAPDGPTTTDRRVPHVSDHASLLCQLCQIVLCLHTFQSVVSLDFPTPGERGGATRSWKPIAHRSSGRSLVTIWGQKIISATEANARII